MPPSQRGTATRNRLAPAGARGRKEKLGARHRAPGEEVDQEAGHVGMRLEQIVVAVADRHPVEGDILSIRAADDYCDVALADGRTLLVTMSLARLLETLPARFARVHKSYAVNRPHVASLAPRPGGGRMLTLSDGSRIPVGRSYGAAVAKWVG